MTLTRTNLSAAFPSVVALCLAGAAHGQYDPKAVRPVEPGVGDINPIGISTRILPIDLRQPMDFERVYRVPGSSRGVGSMMQVGEERFARVSGGVTAVFARSDYVETKHGIRPAIPDGTIFYIGQPPILTPAASGSSQSTLPTSSAGGLVSTRYSAANVGNRVMPVDLRVQGVDDSSFRDVARSMKADEPEPAPNIFTNEQFRRARLRQLLLGRSAQDE